MEISNRNVLIAVIPVFITAITGLVDNSLKWRAEMEQRKYDRQTRLIDKIMEVPSAEKRLSVANFYLGIGVFDGKYMDEIQSAVAQAKGELSERSEQNLTAQFEAAQTPANPEIRKLDTPATWGDKPNDVRSSAIKEAPISATPEEIEAIAKNLERKAAAPPPIGRMIQSEEVRSIFYYDKPLINQ